MLAFAPLVLVVAVLIGLGGMAVAQQRELAAIYRDAEHALAAGDLPAAVDGFAAAAGYRDADQRRAEAEAALAPYVERYRQGQAALAVGRYDDAIAALAPLVHDLPGYRDAETLLAEARRQRVVGLLSAADEAERRRDWVTAIQLVDAAALEKPEDADIAARQQRLRSNHAPLLFVRDGDLYTSTETGREERLVLAGVNATWATWAPDLSAIAYVSFIPESGGVAGTLYVVDSAGRTPRPLTETALAFGWPEWSPDGSSIAYVDVRRFNRFTAEGTLGLWTVDVATGIQREVTGEDYSFATSASWSPDGSRLAFVNRVIVPRGGGYFDVKGGSVHVADLATGVITPINQQEIAKAFWVAWSPDPATDLLLVVLHTGPPGDLAAQRMLLIDPDTQQATVVPTHGIRIGSPAWSVDGKRFAFVEGDHTVVIWEDGLQSWVTISGKVSTQVSWSLDGQVLFIPGASPSQPSWLLPVHGSFGELERVALPFDTENGRYGPPQWSPRRPASQPSGSSEGP